jgi:DNA-binding MurR/RpiR family transcriptional regulator
MSKITAVDDKLTEAAARETLKDLLDRITREFPTLSPQLKLAAECVLGAPQDVAIQSMRSFAASAGIPPSTMVRLAKASGFVSYDAFRQVFQDAVRTTGTDFVSRAEWLQDLPAGDRVSGVVGGMASSILGNVEQGLRANDIADLTRAADALRRARRVHFLGVGGLHPIAAYAYYVARMALPDVRLAEPKMATMVDELVDLGPTDAVVVLSVAPYASETVRSAEFAHGTGAKVVVITDVRTSPIASVASTLLLVPTATPQFFPSQVATVAVLETVLALTVSHGDRDLLARIERVDRHRREQGIYWSNRD